jgi:hypothetical protein
MEETKFANPTPLGLTAFGMTTVLLNLHNIGLWRLGSMVLAMGIFYGGLAQVFAGILEFRRGNTFGTTAFLSFGLFWMSLVFILVAPVLNIYAEASKGAMAAYFVMWGLYTLLMYIPARRINIVLQVVFGTLVILFFLLAVNEGYEKNAISVVAGIDGVICGLSSIYLGMAEVINEYYHRRVIPIG